MADEVRREVALQLAVDTLLHYTAETCAQVYHALRPVGAMTWPAGPLTWEAYASRLTATFAAALAEVQPEAERPRPPWPLPEG